MEFFKNLLYFAIILVVLNLMLVNLEIPYSSLIPTKYKIQKYLGMTNETDSSVPGSYSKNKSFEHEAETDIESGLSYDAIKNMGADIETLRTDMAHLKEAFQSTDKTSLPVARPDKLPQVNTEDLKEVMSKENPYLPPNDQPSSEYRNFANNAQVNNIDNMPRHLIPQVEHTPVYSEPLAHNQNVTEKEAQFGSEQTNLETFFKSNQDLFLDANRHSSYVPDVSEWNEESKFSNILIDRSHNRLDAFNADQPHTPYSYGDKIY